MPNGYVSVLDPFAPSRLAPEASQKSKASLQKSLTPKNAPLSSCCSYRGCHALPTHCAKRGGTRYTTSRDTLLSEGSPFFSTLLSEEWSDSAQSEVFLDRDGELFKHVLRFLRASSEGKVEVVRSLTSPNQTLLHEEATSIS